MNTQSRNKYYSVAALAIIAAASIGLHIYRINYPAQPVYDEIHFATYSADYIAGRAFEDIHPPLGKLIYAAALSFYPHSIAQNAVFSKLLGLGNGSIAVLPVNQNYGNFPYVALRLIGALFGVLLPVALYFLMRSVGAGRIAAALAAFFVVFDDALMLNTRLILLDGMFIVFGITALAFYFGVGKRRRPAFAGFLWGLSLAVKLTGIVFIGPAIIAFALAGAGERKHEWKKLLRFAATGLAVLAMIALAGTFFFSPVARLNALAQITPIKGLPPVAWQESHPIQSYFAADVLEFTFSISNYAYGPLNYYDSSPWYFWPTGQVPMVYYLPANGKGELVLTANEVLWLASTLAVIIGLAFLFRYAKDRFQKINDRRPFFILLGGYLAAMFPFVFFIHRNTFLYHYFPALIFAFGLLAWFITQWLKVDDWTDLTTGKSFILGLVAAVVISGFLAAAPLVYGL